MSDDLLAKHSRALEAAFYKHGSGAFREVLAAEEVAAAGALGRATGIDDPNLLARLALLGIRPETLAALTLIPLIETAWADDVIDERERGAVLDGAVTSGIAPDSASYRLLELWTLERPTPELIAIWREFIAAVSKLLTTRERDSLRAKIIGRAYAVADAAGGLLDAKPNVSPEEWAVMDDLSSAFGKEGRGARPDPAAIDSD